MYTSTCFQPMHTGMVIPRPRRPEPGESAEPRPLGIIRQRRPGRSNDRRRAITESLGAR